MPVTHLSQLFSRYLAGQATEEERQELFRLSLEVDNRAEMDQLLKDFVEKDREDLLELAPEKAEPLYQNILAKVGVQSRPEMAGEKRIIPVFRRGWFKISSAAAILIGISFGTYLLVNNQKTPQPVVTTVVNDDVSPGGNHAVLTLGNGSKIILDSAANGKLATQGTVSITKSNSGKLVYNAPTEKPIEISFNTLTTPTGGQHLLTLADGTKVWLNSASSITYPTAFVGNKREVEITGEVYVEVVHNSKMPFRVKVRDQLIEDLGTAFNINAYNDESSINTTLLEGSVKILVGHKIGKNDVLLKPGQQAQISINPENKSTPSIIVRNGVDTSGVIAWKNGHFHFEKANIQSVMRQLARWYNVEVSYKGSVTSHLFSGDLQRNLTFSQAADLLSDHVRFTIEGKKVIIEQK